MGLRTYDCVPACPGPDFGDVDILVADGLNGGLDVAAIAALHLATRRAAPYLAEAADQGQEFGRLAPAELADNPPEGTTGWLLSKAWKEMMSTPDVGRALTHKVLHHKDPRCSRPWTAGQAGHRRLDQEGGRCPCMA
jgi:hypothetical protein